MTVVNYRSCFW